MGSLSSVLDGMEWAASSGADVVNMSLGSDTAGDGTDPLSLGLDELTETTGTLFVASAKQQRTRRVHRRHPRRRGQGADRGSRGR